MKSFFPIIPNTLYTTDFYRDPSYSINKVVILGNALRDLEVYYTTIEILLNYAPIGSSLDDNVNTESVTLNFVNPPVLNDLVEIDITSLVIPSVSASDFFSLTIKAHSYFRFTLLCFDLVSV